MARSKKTDLAVQEAQANVEAIDNRTRELAPYLDGLPYNPERLVNEIQFHYRNHVATGFEVGKRLVALKANLQHGEFVNHVLQRIGISRQHASHLMAFARTVIETAQLTNGTVDLQSIDTRKAILLGEVVADNPDEVEATGTIGGRTLDEWDAMSREELKRTIRGQQDKIEEGKQQLREAKEKLLAQKEKTEALLSATPSAVCESVTRLGSRLRDALESFDATAQCDDDLEPDSAAILDLVGLRAELRTFHDRVNRIIEERFPAVLDAEVPTDVDLAAAPKGKSKVVDVK